MKVTELVPLRRPGCTLIGELPGPGPWELRALVIEGAEVVVAVSPNAPPQIYRDGKLEPLKFEEGEQWPQTNS